MPPFLGRVHSLRETDMRKSRFTEEPIIKVLFTRADTEQWQNMIEVQSTICAIDEALKGEKARASQ